MPMTVDEHNELLQKLNDPELPHSDRTEALQLLRTDYNDFHQTHNDIVSKNEKFQKDNDDLILSNSKLFRQTGFLDNTDKQKEEEIKNFSETVSVSQLEKGVQ